MRTDVSPSNSGVKWVTEAVSTTVKSLTMEKKTKPPKSPVPTHLQKPELDWGSVDATAKLCKNRTSHPTSPTPLLRQIVRDEEKELLLPPSPSHSTATRSNLHSPHHNKKGTPAGVKPYGKPPRKSRCFRVWKLAHRTLLEWRNNFGVPRELGAITGIPPLPSFSPDYLTRCTVYLCSGFLIIVILLILLREFFPADSELTNYFGAKAGYEGV